MQGEARAQVFVFTHLADVRIFLKLQRPLVGGRHVGQIRQAVAVEVERGVEATGGIADGAAELPVPVVIGGKGAPDVAPPTECLVTVEHDINVAAVGI